jgi:hypothetical protein
MSTSLFPVSATNDPPSSIDAILFIMWCGGCNVLHFDFFSSKMKQKVKFNQLTANENCCEKAKTRVRQDSGAPKVRRNVIQTSVLGSFGLPRHGRMLGSGCDVVREHYPLSRRITDCRNP